MLQTYLSKQPQYIVLPIHLEFKLRCAKKQYYLILKSLGNHGKTVTQGIISYYI